MIFMGFSGVGCQYPEGMVPEVPRHNRPPDGVDVNVKIMRVKNTMWVPPRIRPACKTSGRQRATPGFRQASGIREVKRGLISSVYSWASPARKNLLVTKPLVASEIVRYRGRNNNSRE